MTEIFLYLLATHAAGDWLIQNSWMASQKDKNIAALLAHVVTYHLLVFIVLSLAGIPLMTNLAATLFLAVTHAILDNRKFERWWIRTVNNNKEKEIPTILLLGVDQSFHLILITLVSFWIS